MADHCDHVANCVDVMLFWETNKQTKIRKHKIPPPPPPNIINVTQQQQQQKGILLLLFSIFDYIPNLIIIICKSPVTDIWYVCFINIFQNKM